MKHEWSIVERRLLELANDVLARQHDFTTQQVRWARLFGASVQSQDVFNEWALLDASFPALFSDENWYGYFADRCAKLTDDSGAPGLPDAVLVRIKRLQRRFSAFAGRYSAPKSRSAGSACNSTRPLVIGVDIRPLSIPSTRNRGIGRYLISTLSELVRINNLHRLVFLGDQLAVADDDLRAKFKSDRVTFRELGPACDWDLDVFLLTDPCPMLTGRRTAELPVRHSHWMSIVYDFIPLEFPELYLRGNDTMLDEYLDNVDSPAERSLAVFPISKYVGEQCTAILGLTEDRVVPIMGGVDRELFAPPSHSHAPLDRPYFLYVGGADARKNIPGLIRAFDLARPSLPVNAALVLAGEMTEEKTTRMLSQLSCEHLRGNVIGLGGVADDKLRELYAHAIATVFVSLSEGLGLPALEAMAAGCPVIASNSSALAETVGNCGRLVDPLSSRQISLAMTELATNETLRDQLVTAGREHAENWKWNDVARALLAGIESWTAKRTPGRACSRSMRVAMLNRSNVWSAPGGDGRVMLQMQEAVKQHGIEVYFPQTSGECERADIIHFVNLTLPEPLSMAAKLAESYGAPFVVTTLFEDWAQYLEPSHMTFALARQFVDGRLSLDELTKMVLRQPANGRTPRLEVNDALARTSVLLACGNSEASRLRKEYPQHADRVRVIPFAVTPPSAVEDSVLEAVYRSLGFDQFVLCIGRLETRKNQLMLLAALHNEDIPIVFATGGYTPQPEYRMAVQRWPRNAPVRYVDRISWAGMSALIHAASAHALPSFYELPGLVHLECAAAGIPIAASTWGALTDYLPIGSIHPCEPVDVESIREAVLGALSAPAAPRAIDLAAAYSLDQLGASLAREYETAVSTKSSKHFKSSSYRPSGKVAAQTGGLNVAAQ
ncbi:MAG: glycosyltransferase [bacterium]|nr:glycosyltransferase [bacterium]